jgi:hypothetical protein
MAEETLSEIVEACNEMTADELAEPSLESENAYNGEAEFKPTEEQEDAMQRTIDSLKSDDE